MICHWVVEFWNCVPGVTTYPGASESTKWKFFLAVLKLSRVGMSNIYIVFFMHRCLWDTINVEVKKKWVKSKKLLHLPNFGIGNETDVATNSFHYQLAFLPAIDIWCVIASFISLMHCYCYSPSIKSLGKLILFRFFSPCTIIFPIYKGFSPESFIHWWVTTLTTNWLLLTFTSLLLQNCNLHVTLVIRIGPLFAVFTHLIFLTSNL